MHDDIEIHPRHRDYIDEQVRSGRYRTPAEVVGTALDVLRQRDEDDDYIQWLREEVQKGVDDADAGRVEPFTEQTLEDIKRRGRERLREEQREKRAS